MTKVYKAKTLVVQNIKPLVWLLLVGTIFSLCFYIYAINKTVRNVAKRQSIETELSNLSAQIGESEFKYISIKNGIDLSLAYSIGFENNLETKYVSRKSSVALASQGSPRQ